MDTNGPVVRDMSTGAPSNGRRKKNDMTTSPTYTYVSFNRLGWVMSEEFSLLACFFVLPLSIIKQTVIQMSDSFPVQARMFIDLFEASILTHCNSHPVTAAKLIDLTFDSFVQIPVLYCKVTGDY